MLKTVRQFFKLTNNDHGFTLIEAITLVGVISVLGVVLWSGATLAMRATTDMNSSLDVSSTILKAEHLLREKCAHVRFPFWLGSCALETDESTLTIFYYNGNKEDTLQLRFEDNLLWIKEIVNDPEAGVQEQKEPFGPFEKVEFSTAENQNRGFYGININIWPKQEAGQTEEEEVFAITAEFGSIPLRSVDSDE